MEERIKIKIDSHQHFWKLDRKDYSWLNEDVIALYRDFMPEDLKPFLEKNQIEKTIVVQAAPTVEETLFLLSLYEEHDWIAGVVGWLDLSSSTFNNQLDALLNHPGFIGLRPMLEDLEKDDWILQKEVLQNMELLLKHKIPLDLLIKPKHFPHILRLMKTFPDLHVVIDHLAKPDIKNQQLNDWKNSIEKLSLFPHVMCKVSGLITEASPHKWKISDFKPYIYHVLHTFGTDRIMFGSDWPVCNLSGTYEDVVKVLLNNLPRNLQEKELSKIFGDNAQKFYQIGERRMIRNGKGNV
jgi:L-fuconolactonase